MRFCMKVHRYREICRPGSCVAFRKVRTAAGTNSSGWLLTTCIRSASLPGVVVMLHVDVIPGPIKLDVILEATLRHPLEMWWGKL